jgi:F420-dependent oxidoreductase-like protein
VRTATTVEASGGNWAETVEFVTEAEKLGLDDCWVAEAWGSDAPSALGFLAARTDRIRLGSGVIQVGTRSPVAVAQAALTLHDMSQGRFVLGLGPSGPQVIEGLHGVPFDRPLTRLRETIEVIRAACAGERISHDGDTVAIPLPGGRGRPMRLSTTPVPDLPVFVAALSPRMLELTGRVADGWLGTSFVPEGAAAYLSPLDTGLAAAGRTRADVELCQGAEVAFAAGPGEEAAMVDARRPGIAFSLGGMGTAEQNFYFDAYRRQGWGERADAVRAAWLGGDRAGAAALVTDDMVLGTTLIGTEERVAARLRDWAAAGIGTVRLYPAGDTLDERLTTLARAIGLARAA